MKNVAAWNAENWINCSAYPSVHSKKKADEENRTAKNRGISMHEAAYQRLVTGEWADGTSLTAKTALEFYIRDVDKRREKGTFEEGFETHLKIGSVDLKAAVDGWHCDNEGNLTVWDLKTGFTVVSAVRNWQLILYASGLMDYLASKGQEVTSVSLRIFLPDQFDRRVWEPSIHELNSYIERAVFAKMALDAGESEAKAGDHCKRCSARFKCSAAFDYALDTFNAAQKPFEGDGADPEILERRLVILRRAKSIIENLEKALSAEVKGLLVGGASGFSMFDTRPYSRTEWVDEETLVSVADMYGVNVRQAMTPRQVKDLGLLDEDTIDSLTIKSQTGTQLVQTNVARDFDFEF